MQARTKGLSGKVSARGACLQVEGEVRHAEKHNLREIEREVGRLGPLKRPSNNPGFEEERELFEETCAQVFLRGMRG